MYNVKLFLIHTLWVYFVHFVSLLPQKHNRPFSRATNENLIPFSPGVLNSQWSWTLLATVTTRLFQCHIAEADRTWVSFGLKTSSPVVWQQLGSNTITLCPSGLKLGCICSWDFFSSVLWEAIMCVRVSLGCEVCQIWPSSSAPAASADCGCLRLREAQFMTQGQRGWTHRTSTKVCMICQYKNKTR